jgi:hypothetical protein
MGSTIAHILVELSPETANVRPSGENVKSRSRPGIATEVKRVFELGSQISTAFPRKFHVANIDPSALNRRAFTTG